jgi:hypothetical protein
MMIELYHIGIIMSTKQGNLATITNSMSIRSKDDLQIKIGGMPWQTPYFADLVISQTDSTAPIPAAARPDRFCRSGHGRCCNW